MSDQHETAGSLLLVDHESRAPLLEHQPSASAAARQRPNDQAKTKYLWNEREHPEDLRHQRWGVIAPEGAEGDRLLDAIRPLIRRREEQQGAKAIVYRVPPRMDALEAIDWRRNVFETGAQFRDDLPRYQLVLGDLHQVSADLQAVQAIDAFVGRLAFDSLDDYAAYVDKALRWEERAADGARRRLLMHTVHDGTDSTSVGHRELVAPSYKLLEDKFKYDRSIDVDLQALGSDDPYPGELLSETFDPAPTVLFSLSHGDGAPRRGWRSYDLQRRAQGAMSFGRGGSLTGDELRDRVFLPGGLWFMLACFSAGTPSTSKFERWLRELQASGAQSAAPAEVLRSLPKEGQAPFVAAVPKAALANPDGPLGFVGHVDLAWTYSFRRIDSRDKAQSRPARFAELLRAAATGARIGLAFRQLYSYFTQIDNELVVRQADPNTPAERRGHLWMLRQDLAGYVLLGDPAARLPEPKPEPVEPTAATAQSTGGGADLAGFFGFAVDTSTAAAPAPKKLELRELEAAIGEVLAGASAATIARALGITASELEAKVARYREAGRRALRDAGDV
ncbi:MAG: hypothetical protein KC486_05720 [Myxococcales bacterium]|nr:hypothetical protein [Myxococcales bacterium]